MDKAKPSVRVEYRAKGVICHGLKGKDLRMGNSFHKSLKKRRIKS